METRLLSALPSGWTLHHRIPNGFISEAAAVPGGAGSRVFVAPIEEIASA
jgi:hypothetical protein